MKFYPKNHKTRQISLDLVDHFITTAIYCVGSVLLVLWVGLKLTEDNEGSYSEGVLDYLLANPIMFSLVCLTISVAANAFKYYNKTGKQNIRHVEFNDKNEVLQIGIAKNYSNKIELLDILYEDLDYVLLKKNMKKNKKITKKISFYGYGSPIGILHVDDAIWSREKLLIRRLMKHIKSQDIGNQTQKLDDHIFETLFLA